MSPEEKKDTYEEGLLVVNGVDILRLAATSAEGHLMQTALREEASALNCLPALYVCQPASPYEGGPGVPFQPTELKLFPLELCRSGQSGTRSGDSYLYKPALLWLLECTFQY